MSHSRFRLLISALLVAGGLGGCLGGCGDDGSCGTGDAPADGLTAGDVDVSFVFAGIEAGPNHDCPDPAAPAGVESLTLEGTQENGTGLFTACIPRPDLFTAEAAIGTAMTAAFSLVDLSGSANGCNYTLDRSIPPTGMANAENICDAGTNKAGFILDVDGAVTIKQTAMEPAGCTISTASFAVRITGRAAVTPMM